MTRLTADDFNRLYREHARRAQGFFLRMTGDSMLAEDLTQELFTRLWEHRSRFDARQGEFTTWMFSVAYNLCKNEYRHRSVAGMWDAAPAATEYAQDASAALEREEKKKLLAEAVQHLPDGIREVFLLRYEEELSISDVAQILRIPEGTVKSRAYTALKTLQQQMKQY